MQDIDIEEALVLKVGGKFALTALMQKRMVELNRGAAPLVEVEGEDPDPRAIVVKEILEGKIELALRSEIEAPIKQPDERADAAAKRDAVLPSTKDAAQEGEDVEIYGSDIKKIKEQRIKELSQLLNPKK
jgi:DNA-directed RNA polymerase subunit omega